MKHETGMGMPVGFLGWEVLGDGDEARSCDGAVTGDIWKRDEEGWLELKLVLQGMKRG